MGWKYMALYGNIYRHNLRNKQKSFARNNLNISFR